MKRILVAVSLFAIIYGCKNKDEQKTEKQKDGPVVVTPKDSLLITDSSWGLIKKSDDFESLRNTFGASNLRDQRICGAECVDSVDVTYIYPDSPREITVYWNDSAYHREIGMVEAERGDSPYHTANGLHIGSTLEELLKLNGKKISFSGFGWDYGGGIGSYNGGTLENSSLGIQLDIKEHPGAEQLYGDRSLDTDMKLVRDNLGKIVISAFILSFPR